MMIDIIASIMGGRIKPMDSEEYSEFINEMMEFKHTDDTLHQLETDEPQEINFEFKEEELK